ncbi:MAG: hypothetical protein J0L70_23630 [Leptolyngbya sp. UWPOB_LEPTO1]|nr:hypothetical protein [Leptolyngbya sp. UWPOB_LEPTO1]MBN8563534.1 hypothetical protein [Leptolyngbya sp. UWPOB_LEPTO1]
MPISEFLLAEVTFYEALIENWVSLESYTLKRQKPVYDWLSFNRSGGI